MTQESVRNKLNDYLKSDTGLSLKKVSRIIDVPFTLMSKYKNAKRELWRVDLEKLDEFLKDEAYLRSVLSEHKKAINA